MLGVDQGAQREEAQRHLQTLTQSVERRREAASSAKASLRKLQGDFNKVTEQLCSSMTLKTVPLIVVKSRGKLATVHITTQCCSGLRALD